MSALFLLIDYDTRAFPFHALLAARVFHVRRLRQLHEVWRRQTGRAQLAYADNLKLRALLQRMPDDAPFYLLYHRWVRLVLAPLYGGHIRYSAHPKMRVHLAGTGCVSDFHCDAEVTGRDDQINCYLPFTDVYDGCTLWCQQDYGSDDLRPLNLRYGQALVWDGGRLRHGTLRNDTHSTRVSCDLRFSVPHPERGSSPWRDVLAQRPPAAPLPFTRNEEVSASCQTQVI